MNHIDITEHRNLTKLSENIKIWGRELGFQQIGITDTDLQHAEKQLQRWLDADFHGEMAYMQAHGKKRSQPDKLIPKTFRVISARMDYLPENTRIKATLTNPRKGYISRYALGRDYHRLIRKRLQKLSERIEKAIGPFGYRVFTDSAPVMEKPLAQKAGLGWIGKHTNLIHRKAGSWFFLGEIYTDLALPIDIPETSHCGTCRACIDICPSQAIVAPYHLDARRCISYLTIELKGAIPVELRPLIGNRIYGCDDCQLICPWNKFAKSTKEDAFKPRNDLASPDLIALFQWTEDEFLTKTQGSAIRRISHLQWLRNIAVALGNAPSDPNIIKALKSRSDHPSPLVREHVNWALTRKL